MPFDRKAYSKEHYKSHREQYRERHRKYYQTHKESLKKKIHEYYLNHKNEAKERSRKCYMNHREKAIRRTNEWTINHRELRRAYIRKFDRKFRLNTRQEIIKLLGNKCANPYNLNHGDFETEQLCLQIDHVNGGGLKELGRFSNSNSYYKYVLEQIKAGSKDYQLLCANCNWIKRIKNREYKIPID